MPTTATDGAEEAAGIEAIRRLKSTDPPLYLSPSPDLSKAARLASEYLFSSLKPYTPKSPFSQLLVNGFDAEQIWQQIDLQSQPLISSLRRQVRNFEKSPEEIKKFNLINTKGNDSDVNDEKNRKKLDLEVEGAGLGREVEDFEDEEMEGEDEEMEGFDEEDEDDEVEEEGEQEGNGDGVEDKFLKIKELEEFLEEDEAREYGLKRKKNTKSGKDGKILDEDHHEEEEGEDEDEDDEDDEEEDDELGELGVMGLEDGDDDEGGEGLGNARCSFFCFTVYCPNCRFDIQSLNMPVEIGY